MKYRKETGLVGNEIIVRSNDDGTETWIPADPANSDYQAYLATLASESAPTAQQGVALLIQPLLGVGFSYLERGKAMFDTRTATDKEMLDFFNKQNGKCLCVYCDGCGGDINISWAVCDNCLESKDGKEHGVYTFPAPKTVVVVMDGRGFDQHSTESFDK